MVARSLVSFVVAMAAMAFVTQPWHVFALRAVHGFFAGYGGLTLTMAAESAPRDRMAAAIGTVQTAQRLGPALGPVIGGVLAGAGRAAARVSRDGRVLRVALLLVFVLYDDEAAATQPGSRRTRRRSASASGRVLAFENFLLLMVVIFGIQFVDRSFGPVLPLYLEQLGMTPARRCRLPPACCFR